MSQFLEEHPIIFLLVLGIVVAFVLVYNNASKYSGEEKEKRLPQNLSDIKLIIIIGLAFGALFLLSYLFFESWTN